MESVLCFLGYLLLDLEAGHRIRQFSRHRDRARLRSRLQSVLDELG